MKTFLIFILLLPSSLFAQSKFGFIIGGSASFTNSHYGTSRQGIPFGVSLTQRINDNIFLSQNALFRFDGYGYKQDLPPEIVKGEIIRDLGNKYIVHQINSIEIPFLVNFTTKKGKLKPYFGLGASFKFAVYSAKQISVEYRHFEIYDLPLKNGTDLNLIGLIGTQFKISDHFINVEARYNYGLVTIIDNQKLSSFSLLFFIRK